MIGYPIPTTSRSHHQMSDRSTNTGRRNLDCDWEQFDCDAYVFKNYSEVSSPDRVILEHLIDLHRELPVGGEMIEIGAGPNLYPLMAASRYRDNILVTDISDVNLRYLQHHIASPQAAPPWNRWLSLIQALDTAYRSLGSNLNLLQDRCQFRQLSVFDLSEASYDVSSMHFVAESITNDYGEFVLACQRAVRCVRVGGSFVASFMLSSQGYLTGDVDFPATNVGPDEILSILSSEASDLRHVVLEGYENIVREGHTGILVAIGVR